MKLFKTSLLFWLLTFTLFKGIVWAGIVPLWHFPDEQAHFAQVQNYAEFGKKHYWDEQGTTSQEIAISEELLGTLRNKQGRNRFTHHPEYNLFYTDGFIGKDEEEIKSFPQEFRKEMAINEATSYPPLYYFLASRFYLLVKPFNFFIRVFTTRLFSVLTTVATVWLVYKIGRLVFEKKTLAAALGVLVSFQPMFAFVGSGVSSDTLFNFFFTLFIYASLLVFEKASFKALLYLILSIVGGLLTKQQMAVALLLLPFVLGVSFYKKLKARRRKFFSKKTIVILLAVFLLILAGLKYGEIKVIAGFIKAGKDSTLKDLNLVDHLIWTLRHTIAEVLPWYWGVFKWLGVVLPRWANRVQMRILALAVLGLLIWPVKIIRRRRTEKKDWQVGFLALASIAYLMAVTLWDWQFRKAYGFSFGIQGRYFFPAISAHMALILFGLTQLIPKKLKKWLVFLLFVWWAILLHIGLCTVLKSYYQLWPLNTLWFQLSQYKPFWFKAQWWFLWTGLYVLSLLALITKLSLCIVKEKAVKTKVI